MVAVKNVGIGQGKGGGGRKPRGCDCVEKQFRLTSEAAEMVKAQAKASKQPAWKIVDGLIRAAYGFKLFGTEPLPQAQPQPQAPPLPKEAMDIAQEAADFLTANQNNPKAQKALQRAWKQALMLARHDMGNKSFLNLDLTPAEEKRRQEIIHELKKIERV